MIKIILILLHLVIGIFCIIFFPIINRKLRKKLIMWWSLLLLKIFKINFTSNKKFEKILLNKNYLVVSNHISWLDIFIINSSYPLAFVAKNSISKWPILNLLVKGAETIFIDRKKISKIKETTNEIGDFLETKGSICIFPEGTSTDGSRILKFKGNLLQAAINKDIQILPIVIQYSHNKKFCSAPSYCGDLSLLDSLINIIRLDNIEAKLTILKEIKSKSDRKSLAKKAYLEINKVINKF